MDTILTARSMSQTESEGSDTDILKYAFINEVPEFEETDSKIIHHPTARFLKASSKKVSSFDFLGSPAKQPRLEIPEPEVTINFQVPLESYSTTISDSITLENESNMHVIFPNRLSKVSMKSICESESPEGCHKFSYGDSNENAFKPQVINVEEIKFINVGTKLDNHHLETSQKEFPSSKYYQNYVHWSHSLQSDLVQYITVNEKDMNQNRVEPDIKSISFNGFSVNNRFGTSGTRPILKPVYRLGGLGEVSHKHSIVFLKENDYDSSTELALIELDEMARNPPPEKRRKLNALDEYEYDEEEMEVAKRHDEEKEGETQTVEEEMEKQEWEEEKEMQRDEEETQVKVDMPTMNNNNNNETFNVDIEKKFGVFKICNELTNKSEILSVDLSSAPTFSDYNNPFIMGDLVGVAENNSFQSSSEVTDSLRSSLGVEREFSFEDQYFEILDETAYHSPFMHSTMRNNMPNFGIGNMEMFQQAYTDSTDTAMSIPSGEVIHSQQQPEPEPYRIFVQSSYSGSGTGTDYVYDSIPYFNMFGMDVPTDSDSRIEDVTEDDYCENRQQIIETIFPINDSILSRKESTSCVLVDGLLEYDEEADIMIQDEVDLEMEQQETLMQPIPQLKYSRSFHSDLNTRRHRISKANQLCQKGTKSEFFVDQMRLNNSFDQLCRKRVETPKVSDDVNIDDDSVPELEVCNLQDSIHNQDEKVKIPVTSSKSLFASVKNSLVACYRRFISRNRISDSSSTSPGQDFEENIQVPIIMDSENNENEFEKSCENMSMSNYSTAKCFQAIHENDEICITHIYDKGESLGGSSLPQILANQGILMQMDSQLIIEIPQSALSSLPNNDMTSECKMNIVNIRQDSSSTDAFIPELQQLESINKQSEILQHQEEKVIPAFPVPISSKPLNILQEKLTATVAVSPQESSKECSAKQSILQRFFRMFRLRVGRKSKKTNISRQTDDKVEVQSGNGSSTVEMNNNNKEKAVQSLLVPNSNEIPSAKILAHHTDSRELYRERRQKFFREQKEFGDESIMAYLTNILGASQHPSMNPSSSSKHVSDHAASPTTGESTVSPELLIPAAFPVLSLLNQSKSDEVLITARKAMSECFVPNRKKRLLGQSLVLHIPPVVPIIAAAVAKVQQAAASSKENNYYCDFVNVVSSGPLNGSPVSPVKELSSPVESIAKEDNNENASELLLEPLKGILRNK